MTPTEIQKRNNRLRDLFEKRGIRVQLKGNMARPVVIIDNGLVLRVVLEGFNLRFFDVEDAIRETIKLNNTIRDYPTSDLFGLLNMPSHQAGWRLQLYNYKYDMFVCGWEDNESLFKPGKYFKYPVFSPNNPLVFTKGGAESVIQKVAGAVVQSEYRIKQF